MKKFYLLLSFLFVSITAFTHDIIQSKQSKDIVGEWNFESIRKETNLTGPDLKEIAEGDFMTIKKDGTFSYSLRKVEIKEKGRWDLDTVKLLLTFHYDAIHPDKLHYHKKRVYTVKLQDNKLVLMNDGVNYSFVKKIPEIIPPIELIL